MWRIKIFGTEIKTDSPDVMVRKQAQKAVDTLVVLGDAAKNGDYNKLKEAAGRYILDNNITSIGARKAAQIFFPKIPPDHFARVVGSGVLTYLGTGEVVLTVIAVAEEFYGEYKLQDAGGAAPAAPPPDQKRRPKHYKVECLSLTKKKKADGKYELWASFRSDPVFRTSRGTEFRWPHIDIRPGDVVRLVARTNHFPDTLEEEGRTIPKAVGTYNRPAYDSPGIGRTQIKSTVVFDFVK